MIKKEDYNENYFKRLHKMIEQGMKALVLFVEN